jgi:hypothetical protein
MTSPSRSEIKNFSSVLFHNILNPLTVLSLEIDHQHTTTPKLQNQVDTMLHYLTHLEYFVSLLCENVKHHLFYKQISVNTEIEKALEIISYSAKQKRIHILSFFLSEVSLETNQLQFHQILLELFQIFLSLTDDTPRDNQKIEITLQKKKTHFCLSFSLFGISYETKKLLEIQDTFEKIYNTTSTIQSKNKTILFTIKFPILSQAEQKTSLDE